MGDTESEETKIAVMARDVSHMQTDIEAIKNAIQHGYVTKEEFDPVKRLVYGCVGILLSAIMLALVALIIKS